MFEIHVRNGNNPRMDSDSSGQPAHHRDAQSKEEYDQLVQAYYLARAQHQAEMLRLNQILYGTRPTIQQASAADDARNHRPALQGISSNLQMDTRPHAIDMTRKRVHSGSVEEERNLKRR